MATKTAGTNSTSVLPYAIQWQPAGLSAADLATIRNHILNNTVNGSPIWPGALENGQLYLPTRGGPLKLVPGDWIAIGTTGWPFLIPADAFTADWTHS